MALFLPALITLEMMVVLQGLFAHYDGMFWPSQMRRKGLPFVAHGGMWSDVLLFSPLVALIVACCGQQWSRNQMTVAAIVGLVGSIMMHETYKKVPWPEAHVRAGYLTEAGWVHLLYMAIGIAVLLLYFFATPYTWWMWVVAGLLVIHFVFGTHVVLGLWSPRWYPGQPLQSMGTWGPIGGIAALTTIVITIKMLVR